MGDKALEDKETTETGAVVVTDVPSARSEAVGTAQEVSIGDGASAPAEVAGDEPTTPTGERAAGQHGNVAHSHGGGPQGTATAPGASRASRPTSYEVEDFAAPSVRAEEWKFTPLAPLAPVFEPAGADAVRLGVTVAGDEQVTHSVRPSRQRPSYVPGDRAAAVAWADAEATGGSDVLAIAAEAQLDTPVTVALRSDGGRSVGHLVIEAGPYSRATVVVDHTGSGTIASGIEVRVGEGAHLTVVSVQQWDAGTVHASQQEALVGRDATYRHVAVTLGGALVRVSATVRYDGPGGDAQLLGVYFADAGQHLEHRSFVDHQAERCRSNVTYKGALQGTTARTVWVGDVLIGAGALGTDTYELNRNLVLTDGARADSVPNLEIETGEIVGAGHASATGRFDDEQLFYLCSRGIPADVARAMVVRAFFYEVLQQIGVPEVTERLAAAIDAELAGDGAGGGGEALPHVAEPTLVVPAGPRP